MIRKFKVEIQNLILINKCNINLKKSTIFEKKLTWATVNSATVYCSLFHHSIWTTCTHRIWRWTVTISYLYLIAILTTCLVTRTLRDVGSITTIHCNITFCNSYQKISGIWKTPYGKRQWSLCFKPSFNPGTWKGVRNFLVEYELQLFRETVTFKNYRTRVWNSYHLILKNDPLSAKNIFNFKGRPQGNTGSKECLTLFRT